MTFTHYIVQVLDRGLPKNVPHTGRNNYEFWDRKQAIEFKNSLIQKKPKYKFRLVKKTTKYTPGKWEQK